MTIAIQLTALGDMLQAETETKQRGRESLLRSQALPTAYCVRRGFAVYVRVSVRTG